MPNPFLSQLKEKTLLFDGAMGTMLMKAGQDSLKTPILLNLDEPDLVADIHKQYYAAGADVVITNTFGGSPLKLAADGLEQQLVELNREAVRLTRRSCPDGKFVAGDIGPQWKNAPTTGGCCAGRNAGKFFRTGRGVD